MTCLVFIIPIRHQDSSDNWDVLLDNLEQTVNSICAQTYHDWKCIVVANKGARLPIFPDKFEVCWVDFPPNKLYVQGDSRVDEFRDAVRLDKGKRLFAGIKSAGDASYLMFVDDDDFIHRDLARFVCENTGGYGWFLDKGLVWEDGSNLLMIYDSGFYKFCGTSHIVRSDLLRLLDDETKLDVNYIKRMLGSHVYLKDELDKSRTPLVPLPFRGAIYRIGHSDAHSKVKGIVNTFFSRRKVVRHPLRALRRLFSIRRLTEKLKKTYFGACRK
jgi:glycosyltransferase involved in cell wall biosynthesis